jgi:hypothetical protein
MQMGVILSNISNYLQKFCLKPKGKPQLGLIKRGPAGDGGCSGSITFPTLLSLTSTPEKDLHYP